MAHGVLGPRCERCRHCSQRRGSRPAGARTPHKKKRRGSRGPQCEGRRQPSGPLCEPCRHRKQRQFRALRATRSAQLGQQNSAAAKAPCALELSTSSIDDGTPLNFATCALSSHSPPCCRWQRRRLPEAPVSIAEADVLGGCYLAATSLRLNCQLLIQASYGSLRKIVFHDFHLPFSY